jgi:drug/metabolite transporter (DMT)-like permease
VDLATLGLVVTAAIFHAIWNLLAKRAAAARFFIWSYSATVAVLYAPLVVWALIESRGEWTIGAVLSVFASGVLHLWYSQALQAGYRRADLSVVYPVARGTGPALSVIGAIVLVGEPARALTLIGAALVVSGVMVIGLGNARLDARTAKAGLIWGAFTGVFIASYTVNDGWAVRVLGVSPFVIDYFGNFVRMAALTPGAIRGRATLIKEWRESKWVILMVGAIIPIPFILVLFAMTMAPISVVAPAREMSMMVGVLLGWLILNERDVAKRLIGAALIAAGVAMLTWA